MPTLIAVDCSLSMLAPVHSHIGSETDSSESQLNRKKLAIEGLKHFLNLLSDGPNKQEQISLITFNHEPIYTNLTNMKDANSSVLSILNSVECSSKALFKPLFSLIKERCAQGPSQAGQLTVILVTDGHGTPTETVNELSLPLTTGHNLCTLIVVCVAKIDSNITSKSSEKFFTDILIRNNVGGKNAPQKPIYLDSDTWIGAREVFGQIVRNFFCPAYSILRCGQITTSVQVVPSPRSLPNDIEIDDEIEIVGFARPSELANCPVASRHFLLPLTRHDPEIDAEPNLCVLLHGSIKVENMAALCHIGSSWYGALYHLPDGKRSNLTLNCFFHGTNSIPWLGKLDNLSMRSYDCDASSSKEKLVPVGGPRIKPSYAANPTWWVEPYGLQSDVQKLLRYARKLPERQTVFYQELNRLCHHALALGFSEVIISMANLLEREVMQEVNSLEIRQHCLHVVGKLRNSEELTYGTLIEPPLS